MRAGHDLGDEPQRNVRAFAHGARNAGYLIELEQRIDVDREYSVIDCIANFLVGFRDAVEYDLVRSKSDYPGLVQLATGVDFDVATGASDRIEHRHVGIGLGGVAEFDTTVNRL